MVDEMQVVDPECTANGETAAVNSVKMDFIKHILEANVLNAPLHELHHQMLP